MPTQKPQNSKSKTRQNSYFIVPHLHHHVRSLFLFLGVMFGPEFAQVPKVFMVVPAARSLTLQEMLISPIHPSVIRRSISIL
jgi:hypothetical protein